MASLRMYSFSSYNDELGDVIVYETCVEAATKLLEESLGHSLYKNFIVTSYDNLIPSTNIAQVIHVKSN